jgi:hypothetical protein
MNRRRPLNVRIRAGTALLLAGLAAGCAGDAAEQLFIRPGRYDYLDCREIASARHKLAVQEQELKTLIARAEQDAFGRLIAAASYRGDYLRVQGDQKMLVEVAARKNCPAVPPGAAAPRP